MILITPTWKRLVYNGIEVPLKKITHFEFTGSPDLTIYLIDTPFRVITADLRDFYYTVQDSEPMQFTQIEDLQAFMREKVMPNI